jgi:AhpC/TSA family
MKRLFFTLVLMCAVLSYPLAGANNKETGAMPKVGDLAPDFSLKYSDGHDLKEIKLSQYRGQKQVVLAFYVFAFTGG